MSGGQFNYKQHHIVNIADQIQELLDNPDNQQINDFSESTIEEFRKGITLLRQAYVYAQRIDWLIGDRGELHLPAIDRDRHHRSFLSRNRKCSDQADGKEERA